MKTKNYLKNRLTFGLELKTKPKQKMVVKKIITEKMLKFHVMTVIIRSVFEEDGTLYHNFF